jgi:excisionase family DNA binding protein
MSDHIEILSQQNVSPKTVPRLAHSIEHAADRLDLGRTKVCELIRDRRLRAIKIDGRTLKDALHELLAKSPLAMPEVGSWSADHRKATSAASNQDLPRKRRSPQLSVEVEQILS